MIVLASGQGKKRSVLALAGAAGVVVGFYLIGECTLRLRRGFCLLGLLGFAIAALLFLIMPNTFRSIIFLIFDFLEHSVPSAIIRVLGLLAIAIGVALVYVGIYVV